VGYFVGLRAPWVANGLTATSSNCWTGRGTRTTLTFLRKWWIYPLIAVLAVAVVFTVFRQGHAQTTLEDFKEFARNGEVTTVRLARNDRDFEYELRGSDKTYETSKEPLVSLREVLTEAGLTEDQINRIDIYYQGARRTPFTWVLALLINFLPLIIVVAIVVFFVRRSLKPRRSTL